MADSFEESLANADVEQLTKGDDCDHDGCEKELYELTHIRNSQLETAQRHPEAPEKELVCIHHGIVRRT